MLPVVPLWLFSFLFASPFIHFLSRVYHGWTIPSDTRNATFHAYKIHTLETCRSMYRLTDPSVSFDQRSASDRFERGTRATLIRNATIFTGEYNDTGLVVVHGDILLEHGLVKQLGDLSTVAASNKKLNIVEAQRAWITPGLIDLHSHLGILSLPLLDGAQDANSRQGPVVPWLRAIDALHTHDPGFQLAIASGVTTVQVIPGMRTPSPWVWRRFTIWAIRSAYRKAQQMKNLQDVYCAKAEAGMWSEIQYQPFPTDFQLETLVNVLRGKVKVSVHCNEAVDLDAIARISNEFGFSISAFHGASEAWLTPNLLNKTWGERRAVSIYRLWVLKRESYRGSDFAPRILADANISLVLQSSQATSSPGDLILGAQRAYYHGLQEHFALAAVTSTPATVAGLSHRIGMLQEGFDADVVLWDSHPLNIGATPLMVWIDGIHQIPAKAANESVVLKEDRSALEMAPTWDQERNTSLTHEGLPPLNGHKEAGKVVFYKVQEVGIRRSDGELEVIFKATNNESLAVVVVDKGKVICADVYCSEFEAEASAYIDTHGGSISPGFLSYGSPLGMSEIAAEPSTGNGGSYDAFISNVPEIFHDSGGVARAVDALVFQTRNALLAYRSGVTSVVSFWTKPLMVAGEGPVISGLSAAFRPGSLHAMKYGAILQDVVALHVTIAKPRRAGGVSVSEQIAGLRRLLYGWESTETETGTWFKKASEGVVPFVIDVHSADTMATLLILKAQVEDKIGSRMRMVFSGATEAHLLAQEIAQAGVGVILNPVRPIPLTWDERRILPGPPLSNETGLAVLLKHGVLVGIGAREPQMARSVRFDLASIMVRESMEWADAYSLASKNLETLLGLRVMNEDLVVYSGGHAFELSSKAVAVVSPQMGFVDLF
ncbi:hypothetical protein BDZ89DRAFT_1088087 [Hymenopellis radicata]|nr:hypothetical protein BDZ89DRAFT_1088087 [Hymenopellis radicata]